MSRRDMSGGKWDFQKGQGILRQRIVVIALSFVIVLGSILFWTVGKSKASVEHESFKYYTSVRIEQGDTLWSIANHYMGPEYQDIQEYIAEIKRLNKLGPDEIHSGQYLTVPYYSREFR